MKIVAPAGNIERFYAAIKASADEIYLGLKGFGARRNAENFTLDQIKEVINYAHLRGSRIFLTLNTIMTNKEIEILYPILKELYNYGLDAIIVQDIGYAKYLHENFPSIEIHGSTQLTVANHYEINYLKTLGFKRIVLPRELTFEEIKEIRKNTDMELEVFVSGSLCVSFSGNCYLSSFIGGRSGNRGMCAQPCRKEYKNMCGETSYFLSPKDQLLGFEEIKKLKDIGIESIKIEGRMKDVNYVYETVNYYKNLIDGINTEENTSKIFNRGYSKGYFYGEDKNIINNLYSYNMGIKIGEIQGKYVKLCKDVICGDGITFISSNYKNLGGEFLNKLKIVGVNENRKIAHTGESILLKFPKGTKYIFKNFDKKINDEINKSIKKNDKKLSIYGKFIGEIGKFPKFILSLKKEEKVLIEVKVEGDNKVQLPLKKGISIEDLKIKLSELGDSEFILKKLEILIEEDIFIPLSELKNLKRRTVEEFRKKLLEYFKRNIEEELKEKNKNYYKIEIEKDTEKDIKFIVIVSNEEQYRYLMQCKKQYGIDKIYFRTYDVAKQSNLSNHNLNNPLASNFYELLENKNSKVLLNWNMNITNSYTLKVLENIKKLDSIIVSPELNFTKIKELGKTRLKKAVLVYSKLKGMTIDLKLSEDREDIFNAEGDKYIVTKNKFGTEIFIDKALNILNLTEKLKKIYVDILVLEFTIEKKEEIDKILEQIKTKKGEYREYNYKRGVY